MPRRQSVAVQACELCRHKKRRCDGDGTNPCKACQETDANCVYLVTPRVTKADLRQELSRLRSINSDNTALIEAIASHETSPAKLHDILQRLSDGQPRAQVAETLSQSPDSHDGTRKGGSPSTSAPTSASPMSPKVRPPNHQDSSGSSSAAASTPPTATSAPDARFLWPGLGTYRSQVPQLLDDILARNCLSFCPISKEDFARDFASGAGPCCSVALVDALLALATLLARGKVAALAVPPPEDNAHEDLDDEFAHEAAAALYNSIGLPSLVADIQALGILALYCINRGKLRDGRQFASDFGNAIAEQWAVCQSAPLFAHRQMYASIYCAAVSLNRLLFLIQDYDKTLDELADKAGLKWPLLYDGSSSSSSSTSSNSSATNLSGSIIDDDFFTRDLSLLPNNQKVIAAKVFELAEWHYHARCDGEKTFDQALKVFRDGLQCTYYQFGILCLLTPFVLEPIEVAPDGTRPSVFCRQAASNIEQLIQHYSKLYDDAALFNFMSLFKSAALAFRKIYDAKDGNVNADR